MVNYKGYTDRLDYIKIKNSYSSTDIIKRMNRKATKWEKVFAIHIFNKELISRIYKVFRQTNKKNANSPIEKLTKDGSQTGPQPQRAKRD